LGQAASDSEPQKVYEFRQLVTIGSTFRTAIGTETTGLGLAFEKAK
jgi:hypothetical protein